MTKTGRILLFVNLALSLVFAFWGFGVYSQRINWTNQKIGDREGEYTKRLDQIKRYHEARLRGEANWEAALKPLLTEEANRPRYQKWYADQLENLRTGKVPVLGVVFDKGEIRIGKDGLPVLGPVVDATKKPLEGLKSIKRLNEDYAAKHEAISKVTKEIDELVEQEKKLTEELGDGQDKGLRFRLAEEQRAEQNSEKEQEYIKTPLYNAKVEAQSLADRQKVLETRLRQLKVAKQQP
jgi:hypothetical protein